MVDLKSLTRGELEAYLAEPVSYTHLKKWSVKPSSWNFKGITDFFRGKKKGDSDDVG